MTEDEIILTHILQCQPIDLILNKPALTPALQKQFYDYKSRRESGEPLQYILGTCNFMGLELKVNPSVLIPRPETEQLVDAALKIFTKGRALDLGTGSGNIAIALAKFVPQAHIVGIDASAQALEVARENATVHQVEDRIEFIEADMKRILSSVIASEAKQSLKIASLPSAPRSSYRTLAIARNDTDQFDLIISNPPYIPINQLKFLPKDVQQEPVSALDGGEDGLNFYRIIIKYSPSLLREGGYLMMEFGDGQAEAIKKLIEAQRVFSNIEIIKDLAGRDRIIKAEKEWKNLSLKAAGL